ncbi:MAG: ATP-binding cassette domain-containing protein [Pygmaiobacter sp.]|nr:ATP-binding cassette domain-containing protein [Pygmaiobacter sp.]
MGVQLKHVSKSIHGVAVLTDVNVTFHAGEITGLRGINGSGKTMIMRCVAGLIRPTKGEIEIDGKVLWRDIAFPQDVGLLIENPAFLPYQTGAQNLQMLADIKAKVGKARVAEVLGQVGLVPDDKRKYHQFSLGMKQRLGIAAAVMEHPRLLILDEPTNALDTEGIQRLQNLLACEKANGSIILLSCHDYQLLKTLSDVICQVERGSVVGCEPSESAPDA